MFCFTFRRNILIGIYKLSMHGKRMAMSLIASKRSVIQIRKRKKVYFQKIVWLSLVRKYKWSWLPSKRRRARSIKVLGDNLWYQRRQSVWAGRWRFWGWGIPGGKIPSGKIQGERFNVGRFQVGRQMWECASMEIISCSPSSSWTPLCSASHPFKIV